MIASLPDAFLTIPLAHRALHDRSTGRPENTIGAIRTAVKAGYGIEIDVQPSADGVAMVFHDDDLGRLTDETGSTSSLNASELARLSVLGSRETIPTLSAALSEVAGRVPILIEIKDQDGAMGSNIGVLEKAVADAIAGYSGPVAVMSFNPNSVAEMARLCPWVPRGITTAGYEGTSWDPLPEPRREELRAIPDIMRVGATFISHEAADLGRERVSEIKSSGIGILTWTIRSHAEESEARRVADNITFEGYVPALPGA